MSYFPVLSTFETKIDVYANGFILLPLGLVWGSNAACYKLPSSPV